MLEHNLGEAPALFKQGIANSLKFFFLVTTAFLLFYIDSHYAVTQALRQTVGTIFSPLEILASLPRQAFHQLSGYFLTQTTLQEENKVLRQELSELRLLTQKTTALQAENNHLNALLGIKQHWIEKNVSAVQILKEIRTPFRQAIVINRGQLAGIAAGMPVVSEKGLIGQVQRVYPDRAEVLLVGDKALSIPIQMASNGQRAVATGQENSATLMLRFFGTPSTLMQGDTAFTSGLDGMYPQGIRVCTVIAIAAEEHPNTVCVPEAVDYWNTLYVVLVAS